MKTLYLSDLDGTLLGADSRLSQTSAQLLSRLTAQGLLFSYATARSYSTASIVTDNLSVNIPVIVYNGGAIITSKTKKALHRVLFSEEEKDYVKLKLLKHGLSPLVYSVEGETERVSYNREKITPGMADYLDSRRGDSRLTPCSGGAVFDHNPFYYTVIGPKEALLPLYEQLAADPRFNASLQPDMGGFWLEIMPKKSTKAHAAIRLKKMLNCDELVVFGDNLNDIPLFELADRCYAVENAVERLKVMSTLTIGHHADDAVANFIAADFTPGRS